METLEASRLRVGTRVGVADLVRRNDLNGHEAVVVLLAADRVGVRILQTDEAVRVRPENLVHLPNIYERLEENTDLLQMVVHRLDVPSLCNARAANRLWHSLCRSELATKSVRALYEYERQQPDADSTALMRRAYDCDDFGTGAADWFANSDAPRTVRPAGMRFRVGDAFFHAQTGAFGVVLGWDDRRKAPLRSWGQLRPERLYAVHYSVWEVPDPSIEPAVEGSSRYIIEDNMLSLAQIWSGHLPENALAYSAASRTYHAYAHAVEAWDLPSEFSRDPEIAAEEQERLEAFRQQYSLNELWWHALPENPWRRSELAAFNGFLQRELFTREESRGRGFMPGAALCARYPADGPFWGQ